MSASKSMERFQSKLNALQCHFRWNLDTTELKLKRIWDKLEDIGTEEGNVWLGHIYNLQGFIQYKLGCTEDAKSLFTKAAEAFKLMRKEDEGPWLVVNYGNLAWLHHDLGQAEESQTYLSKVDALIKKSPSPSSDDLHPEIYAEKGWTMMRFGAKQIPKVAEYFEKALSMQPDMVEWNTSWVIGQVRASKHSDTGVEADVLEKMRNAKEQDPENLFLAAVYLQQLAKKGEPIKDQARELASLVLRNPVSSYSGIKPLLRVYIHNVSVDEAIDLAEEALKKHPDSRYLKRCVALCYKSKILFFRESRPRPGMMERAISLHKEVISLYPNSSFVKKIDLASIYGKSSETLNKAEHIFQTLLRSELEPAEKQVLYNRFATFLFFVKKDSKGSIQFHMRAAAIPEKCFYRSHSIARLKKIRDTSRNRRNRELEDFLAKLQE